MTDNEVLQTISYLVKFHEYNSSNQSCVHQSLLHDLGLLLPSVCQGFLKTKQVRKFKISLIYVRLTAGLLYYSGISEESIRLGPAHQWRIAMSSKI